jgi:Flp pilus assembly protein TadD
VLAQLQGAVAHLQAGRAREAKALLEQVLRVAPKLADALHLYGLALLRLGDPAAAEGPARQAIAIDKRQPAFHVALGDILIQQGATGKAEASYRAALALSRRHAPAVRQLMVLLTRQGRAVEAVQAGRPLAAAGAMTDIALLFAYAEALKAAGEMDEALATLEKAVAAEPKSGVAEHNLAALQGDLGHAEAAEAGARRALAKGVEAPETRLVLARALSALGRYDEAEAELHTALQRNPHHLGAHRDYAQLIWMRTEDVGEATRAVDAVLARQPDAGAFRQLKAKLLAFAGDAAGADVVLQDGAARSPGDAELQKSAAQAAIAAGDAARGLAHAERAQALAPDDLGARLFTCEALLALGRADEAAAIAESMLSVQPYDQEALAYLAVAWRLMGDERYGQLYDYEAFVRAWTIDAPPGWGSLSSYLDDLAEGLNAAHTLKTHPLDQSLRQGSQVSHILRSPHPALAAFAKAVDGSIRAHMAALGKGKDPLRARNTGRYRFQGAWSVKLRPGGGRHVDHLHPEGWLSSACYIDLPTAVAGEDKQGWIKFGEPGLRTIPPLGPEHVVKPEPGMLVLFPSYMWHGTLPFAGEESRLTVAFDLVPEPRR